MPTTSDEEIMEIINDYVLVQKTKTLMDITRDLKSNVLPKSLRRIIEDISQKTGAHQAAVVARFQRIAQILMSRLHSAQQYYQKAETPSTPTKLDADSILFGI